MDQNPPGTHEPTEPTRNPEPGPPPPAAGEATPPVAAGGLTDDDRNFAMLGHLLGAFTSFVGPLIVWLMKKDESAFANQEAKESLNFQITLMIGYLIVSVLAVITCGIGALLYPVLMIAGLVFAIIAAMKAKDGIPYRYPFTLRLVK